MLATMPLLPMVREPIPDMGYVMGSDTCNQEKRLQDNKSTPVQQ
jgi:hypothetical protein